MLALAKPNIRTQMAVNSFLIGKSVHLNHDYKPPYIGYVHHEQLPINPCGLTSVPGLEGIILSDPIHLVHFNFDGTDANRDVVYVDSVLNSRMLLRFLRLCLVWHKVWI